MKKSIAKTMAWQIVAVLLVAMVIINAGSYLIASRIIYGENMRLASIALELFADHITEYSKNNNIPIDPEHAEEVIRYGNIICKKYYADYVYLYTIDDEYTSVTYIGTAIRDSDIEKKSENNMVGRHVECELYPEEISVWNEEVTSATVTYNNSFGHEISTLRLIRDCEGQKILAGVDISSDYVYKKVISAFCVLAILSTVALAGIGVALYFLIQKRISKPARQISRRMHNYISGEEIKCQERLEVKGKDEFSMIAESFNRMTDNINLYVNNIKLLTTDRANRDAEINIAAGIQRDLLENTVFDCKHCDIRCVMEPAKDIGGDFYDYLDLGNGKYLIVIGDVSGKGISAAMVMAMTLTIIRQFAKMGFPPDEILKKANNVLSEKNKKLLFITAFIGIYDSEKMSFTYSNAGHNIPYIISDGIRTLDSESGLVIGLYPGEEYHRNTVDMKPGETIFLYTDGVNESINSEKKFWGTAELEKALSKYHRSGEENITDYIFTKVKDFSSGAEQFDDITMLALTAKLECSLELKYDIHELERIKAEILNAPVDRSTQLELYLAAEEVFVNICNYSFDGDLPEDESINFSLTVSDRIRMMFVDNGKKYNPLEEINPPDESEDFQIGGLGKFLTSSMTDKMHYEYIDEKNTFTLTKYFRR